MHKSLERLAAAPRGQGIPRLNGRPVVAGLPVPTDDLVPVAGGPS